MAHMGADSPRSTGSSLIAICLIALVTHQIFRRVETYAFTIHFSLLCAPLLLSFELLRGTMPAVWAALVSSATFLSTLFLSIAFYRLSPFHPLAQYPGPLMCKLTKFWMAYLSLEGYQHLYVQRLHDRYGDVVRIGPNELSFKDASIVNAVLGAGGPHRGPHLAGRALSITDVPFVVLMDPAVHAERRKPWIRAFSPAALKEYEPMIAHRVNQLVHVLAKQPGEVIMGKFFNYFAYDFMCDMAFGGGSELLREGDKDNIWHIIEDGLPGCTFLSHVPYLGVYCGRLPILRPAVDHLLSYSMKLVRDRLERGSKVKDIFHYLASLLQTASKNNEGQPDKPAPPVQYLLNEGSLAVLAGSDTTSSALTSLIFCLLTHPAALRQLQVEVDLFYPREDDPCDPKHHREMHFLDAVIFETMRLYPPLPSGSQRQVPHRKKGVMLGPYFVPGGTMVFLPPYILHRDPRNFSPFPDDFWPERWLVAAGRTSLSDALAHAPANVNEADKVTFVHNDTAFIPFSHGPANCVGKQLAMQEMRTVVSALIQKFDFSLRSNWDVKEYDKGFKDYYVTTRPDVPVVLRPRF
ncbi:high nitrogen upregulated cytochrome P450 monooxygenase 2 [Trametes sanguinea]|nr:high nitrogen upregulated cytochrome P450 monooxygenase 2 [Trametes sanguinea]